MQVGLIYMLFGTVTSVPWIRPWGSGCLGTAGGTLVTAPIKKRKGLKEVL